MPQTNEAPARSQAEPWSIRRLVAWAADDFRRRGQPSPRLDAELLLGAATGLDRIALIVNAERELGERELATFRELIKRRRTGEPIAYILGKREFFGHEFRVDRRVLIPRPDTECLVEAALETTTHRDMHGRALDLCTGSGAVAIAFAKARPTWRVTATDVDPAALDVAAANALRLGAFNVELSAGDLYGALAAQTTFDLITANPPYIPRDEIPELQSDIRDFEPHLALDGGPAGLDFLERIVLGARPHLEPDGVLALEIGSDQGECTTEAFQRAGYAEIRVRRDYGGRDRVVTGVRNE